MSPAVVFSLLKRRPFVPFVIFLPTDLNVEVGRIEVNRPESVKIFGDETLELFDSETKQTTLIDLGQVWRIEVKGRMQD